MFRPDAFLYFRHGLEEKATETESRPCRCGPDLLRFRKDRRRCLSGLSRQQYRIAFLAAQVLAVHLAVALIKVFRKRMGARGKEETPFSKGFPPSPAQQLYRLHASTKFLAQWGTAGAKICVQQAKVRWERSPSKRTPFSSYMPVPGERVRQQEGFGPVGHSQRE